MLRLKTLRRNVRKQVPQQRMLKLKAKQATIEKRLNALKKRHRQTPTTERNLAN